ncbi:MAG: hypothetical protein HQL68_04175 [Magnetococcales bacterium]|nr:hypothetical protein [Magnetococcales bacterium]
MLIYEFSLSTTCSKYHWLLLVTMLLSLLLLNSPLHATTQTDPLPPSQDEAMVEVKKNTAKLNDIQADLKQRKLEREKKAAAIKRFPSGPEREKLEEELAQLNSSITEQMQAFDLIITGGVKLAQLKSADEKKFDWQKDLLDIVRPIITELYQLTGEKRKIHNLRNSIGFHKEQLQIVRNTLKTIKNIDKNELERETAQLFLEVQKQWQEKAKEHKHLLEVGQLQLQEITRKKENTSLNWEQLWRQFVDGRVTTLLLSIGGAIIAYFLLVLPLRMIGTISNGQIFAQRSFFVRLAVIIYRVFAVIMTTIVFFMIINSRDDRVLEGLFILLIFAFLISLKNSAPKYLEELKLLLNIGPVQEGEVVEYRGVLWEITAMDMFARLYNPAMSEPRIRVPLRDMARLHSRRKHADEMLFPCTSGEHVILADNQYGQVKWISPETVALRIAGNSVRSYTTGDFLGKSPKNLSSGFSVAVVFGIDYRHQADCTMTIPQTLRDDMEAGLANRPFGPQVTLVKVEFDEAALSSLNLKIMVTFEGSAAASYYPAQRAIQRIAVESCHRHGWGIPFPQLTVHQV